MCVHSTSKSSTKFYHLFGARRFVSPLGTLLVILFIYLFIYFVIVCNPLISLILLVLSKTNKVESCLSHQIYYQSTFFPRFGHCNGLFFFPWMDEHKLWSV